MIRSVGMTFVTLAGTDKRWRASAGAELPAEVWNENKWKEQPGDGSSRRGEVEEEGQVVARLGHAFLGSR